MERNSGSKRAWIHGSTLGAGVILALALFGIVNYFGIKYHKRLDWTSNHIYTLSQKSLNVLKDLKKPIDVVVFMKPGDQLFQPVRELLDRYASASPLIKVRVVDPEKNLAQAQALVNKYKIKQLDVIVFDRGNDRRVVNRAELASYDYSGMRFGQAPRMTGFKGEQQFTGAILGLEENHKPKVLFTTGHGEEQLDDPGSNGWSQAADLLGRDNFDLEEWASLGKTSVPKGTDLVVIAGPKNGFTAPEVQVLKQYLDNGGRLLVFLDPTIEPGGKLAKTGLGGLLSNFGVQVGNDIVIDPSNPLPFFGADTIYVSAYGSQAIVDPLAQARVPVIFPLARSISAEKGVSGYKVTELLHTGKQGWGETDLVHLQQVKKDKNDVPGPVSLGVAVEAEKAQKSKAGAEATTAGKTADQTSDKAKSPPSSQPAMRLVVYGDSNFATNGQLANVGNATLLANTFNWLVKRESLVTIPPKKPEQVRLNLSAAQLGRITWLVLVIMPGLAIVLGVGVFLRRRR